MLPFSAFKVIGSPNSLLTRQSPSGVLAQPFVVSGGLVKMVPFPLHVRLRAYALMPGLLLMASR